MSVVTNDEMCQEAPLIHTNHDTNTSFIARLQSPTSTPNPSSEPSRKPTSESNPYSNSQSNSQIGRINEIIKRIHDEKIPYIGIYKPGELGGETWRAVVPSPRRRGKGRGLRGGWESIVLSTPTKGEIVRLLDRVQDEDGPIGVRHIVNPHCDQDEGMRIVWSDAKEGGEEMRDWSRRDRMMRDGKTVRALVPVGDGGDVGFVPMAMPGPIMLGYPTVPTWDNIGWTRLC